MQPRLYRSRAIDRPSFVWLRPERLQGFDPRARSRYQKTHAHTFAPSLSLPASSDDRKETCATSRSDPLADSDPASTTAARASPDLQPVREPEKERAGKTKTRSASRSDPLHESNATELSESQTMTLRRAV